MAEWTKEQLDELFRTWREYRNLGKLQKVRILFAYLKLVLGVSAKTATAFSCGDEFAWREVGKRQAALTCEDVRPFWDTVAKIRPCDYTEEVLALLCQPPDLSAIRRMIDNMEPPGEADTLLGRLIHRNARQYNS